MSKIYKKHVFICQNQRTSSKEKSCGEIGVPLRNLLKKEMTDKQLNNKIRINKSGCLGQCSQGPCFVIYPKTEWHFNVKLEDFDKITNLLTEES